MPSATSEKLQIYFEEPRLRMTIAGRIVVRILSSLMYLVLAATTLTFLISEMRPLVAVGALLLLFFADLLVHYHEGDVPISELPTTGRVNAAETLPPKTFSILSHAMDHAVLGRREFYIEVAKRLLELPLVGEGLRRLDVDPKEFRQKLDDLSKEALPHPDFRADCLDKAARLGVAAFNEAVAAGHDFISPSDLFSALAKVESPEMDRLFGMFTIDPGDLERSLIFSAVVHPRFGKLPLSLGGFIHESSHHLRHRVMNRAWTSRPTPTLDKYGTDFTDLARDAQVGFLVGHSEEYNRLVEALARPTNPNAILVGEAGIGKETIVQHLAFNLTKDDVPRGLFDRRLVGLHLESLVAGAPPEELSLRVKKIVEEIFMAGNIILYIPNIHNLVRTSGDAYISAADALMPVIMNNMFPVVGTTFPKEFKQFLENRSDFTGAFEVIRVDEVTEAEAERILTYQSAILEEQSGITISFGSIKRAVILAKKYFRSKFLPSSGEELLKSAVVEAERLGEKTLTPDRVTTVAESKTNVPMHEAEGAEAERLLNLEGDIHKRFVDQEEAVKAVAQAIREYRSGLTRRGGPIASFLFVGPTGVGKTELAKILADIQFGSEKMMVRFDMTEYQDKQSFFHFVGSPDGSVRGALTDAVLERPYCLILLDEFEKAYPDILNLFLQVLDDGRLTDNLGRTVDFTNTIIIATSNAHSDLINEALAKGETMTDIADYLKARLVDVFKPELLNRFSKIIVFKNLEPKDLSTIVKFNVEEVADIMRKQGIGLEFSPEALAMIAKLGYDPQFGARPLRRVIEERVRAPLAEVILAQKAAKGCTISCGVSTTGDSFDFVVKN